MGRVWFALETAWTERPAFWIHVLGSSPCGSQSASVAGQNGGYILVGHSHRHSRIPQFESSIHPCCSTQRQTHNRTDGCDDQLPIPKHVTGFCGKISLPVRVMGCSKVCCFHRHSVLIPPRMCPRTILLLSSECLGWHASGLRSKQHNLRHPPRFRVACCSKRNVTGGLCDASYGSSSGLSDEVREVKSLLLTERKEEKKN